MAQHGSESRNAWQIDNVRDPCHSELSALRREAYKNLISANRSRTIDNSDDREECQISVDKFLCAIVAARSS